jgi:uncharacterized membrane protein YfcA
VTASLVIVGANSALGAYFHRARGALNWRVALSFGGAGMAAAYLAAGASKHVPPTTLMILFALLMLAVGGLMLRRGVGRDACQPRSWHTAVLSGALVGVLTGFLGVGGGFLIVPALVMLVGLPMREAVGTSLVVIAMNSAAGLLGHLSGVQLDALVLLAFVVAGLAGTFAGSRLVQRVSPQVLRRGFAVFVIGLALALLVDNVGKLV